jgi:hypothetical protein
MSGTYGYDELKRSGSVIGKCGLCREQDLKFVLLPAIAKG